MSLIVELLHITLLDTGECITTPDMLLLFSKSNWVNTRCPLPLSLSHPQCCELLCFRAGDQSGGPELMSQQKLLIFLTHARTSISHTKLKSPPLQFMASTKLSKIDLIRFKVKAQSKGSSRHAIPGVFHPTNAKTIFRATWAAGLQVWCSNVGNFMKPTLRLVAGCQRATDQSHCKTNLQFSKLRPSHWSREPLSLIKT